MAIPVEHKAVEDASFQTQPRPDSRPNGQWHSGLALGAILVAAFWPILTSMYGSWFDERSYMEHGILVVPAAAYMAWAKRDKLAAIPIRPIPVGEWACWPGAHCKLCWERLGQWVWISRMAFLVSFVGCIALVYGVQMIRELDLSAGYAASDDRSAQFCF